ncbi:hypothetical protein MGU_11251 [Metarhizium guizhouense ARSEF 977]|uniref:HNH nuclease domain-containing protein n=1 Tax=Metarhizium guizhouense (strain ARSEF 977) TaxID=1276136 RepID=A0A0B4GV39_METGA|nr:hypothetical protein MGU_11251 [Metarhizium guizhouense ARSEF 977]
MSSAAISPEFRVLGWNVHILCGPDGDRFAGLFHPPGSSSLTYRNIVNDLRLCFDIPINSGTELGDNDDTWTDIAFGYESSIGGNLQPLDDASSQAVSSRRLISGLCLDELVLTPPSNPLSDHARPHILRLHVVRHAACGIGHTEPFTAHLRTGCAKHILHPSRRRDERYLPPNKASGDPRFARLPYRKTMRPTRGSQSPPKRSASGSVAPTKDSQSINESDNADDVTNMVAPPTFDIPSEQARQTMTAFRTSCLAASTKCAVTGKGQSWYMNPNVGPAVQACHIVPQQHYHVYPTPSSFGNSLYSPRRLREAWKCTWSAENGLLLLSHLHELFDARLFSIHPETLRVRVFMPYDVLLDYHDNIAQLSPIVDRKALRHHYEMCCVENMAAKMPMSESFAPDMVSRSAASGAISPSESSLRTPTILSLTSGGNDSPQDTPGDPSKRARSTPGESAGDTVQFTHGIGPLVVNDSPTPSSSLGKDMCDTLHPGTSRKKRKRDSESQNTFGFCDLDGRSKNRLRDPHWDGCLTQFNCEAFLADVNWELGKLEGLL